MGIDGVLVGGGQEEGRKGYLQLALIPFDPLGGAVTLASHHLAHVGMAVALAGCQTEREREEREREREIGVQHDMSSTLGPAIKEGGMQRPIRNAVASLKV